MPFYTNSTHRPLGIPFTQFGNVTQDIDMIAPRCKGMSSNLKVHLGRRSGLFQEDRDLWLRVGPECEPTTQIIDGDSPFHLSDCQ